MEPERIKHKEYAFLASALRKGIDREVITSEQSNALLEMFAPKKAIDFPVILLGVGAVVVGLGILLLIASNWEEIPRVARFIMLAGTYGGLAYVGANKYQEGSIMGRVLLYLAAFVFGGGLILVGQTFNTNSGDFSTLIAMWFLGLLPLLYIMRDNIIFTMILIIFNIYIYSNNHVDFNNAGLDFSYLSVIFPLFIWIQKYLKENVFNSILVMLTVFSVYYSYIIVLEPHHISLPLFLACVLAVILFFAAKLLPGHSAAIELTNLLALGIMSFILSMTVVYELHASTLLVVIPACVYFLALVKIKESRVSLLFFGVMVMRLYFSTLYDYMPKGLFFIIAGLIIVSLGYWLLKLRKGGTHVEQF